MEYNTQASSLLLGVIMRNANLLNEQYNINSVDFEPNKFHKELFIIIEKFAKIGIIEITPQDIGSAIETKPEIKKIFENNNYIDFIRTTKTMANDIAVYYNEVKEATKIRELEKMAQKVIALSKKTEINVIEKLSQLTNEITNKIEEKKTHKLVLGSGLQELKERNKLAPSFGAMLQSPYLSTIYRGWERGALLLRSANSGFGKTMLSVGDLAYVSLKEFYSEKKGKFIENANFRGNGLFINTEMSLLKEVSVMFACWAGNVDRYKFNDGHYDGDEEKRIDYAIKTMEGNGTIFLEDLPEFTVEKIDALIRQYTTQHNVQYVVFDYIEDNGFIGQEMGRTHTVIARDTITLYLSRALKQIAKKYNVGILSMTQLNAQHKTSDVIDEGCLSGGRSVQNKIDAGSILYNLRTKEQEVCELMCKELSIYDKIPNTVEHIYKGRASRYGKNIKIFSHIDLGTGRRVDQFALNYNDRPINIPKSTI